MNKILPIILVVVLSGCTTVEERYADKPFVPDSARGSLIKPIFGVFFNSDTDERDCKETAYAYCDSTPKKVPQRTRFNWDTYKACISQENKRESSIKDYFQDTSYRNIVDCESNKKVCQYDCNHHERKLENFSNLLLDEVEDGNISSSQAKIELIKYIDMTISQYQQAINQKKHEDYIKVLEQQIAQERRSRIYNEVFDNDDFEINILKDRIRKLEYDK